MKKGSGTRSGLLWEVERLLNETKELPDILLMENVPQVVGKNNIADFHMWQDFLVEKGYTNYVQIMNAKDYGVAQNRERCFMVSILGRYNFHFPDTIPLTKTISDYLEDNVDEKYYINSEKAQQLIDKLIVDETIETESDFIMGESNFNQRGKTTNKGEGQKICVDLTINNPSCLDISNCITSRENRSISNLKKVGTGVVECQKKS